MLSPLVACHATHTAAWGYFFTEYQEFLVSPFLQLVKVSPNSSSALQIIDFFFLKVAIICRAAEGAVNSIIQVINRITPSCDP